MYNQGYPAAVGHPAAPGYPAPQGYPAGPQGYPAGPQGYSAAPQGYSAAPQGYSAAPQGYPAAPQGHSAGQGYQANPGYASQGNFATSPPPRPAPLRVKLANKERGIYANLLQRADPESTGKVEGRVAAEFFRKSSLPVDVLREVWSLSTPNGEAFLDKERFYVAMRLIALAQQGKPATAESIANNVEADPPQFTFQSAVPESAETFEIAPEDRAKFDGSFNSMGGQKGYLTGPEARSLLVGTGVNYEDLARIWGMADPRDSGQLTRNQFLVAMQLIMKVKQGVRLPDVLPPALQAILLAPPSVPQPQAPKPEAFSEFQDFNPSGFASNQPPVGGFVQNPSAGPGFPSQLSGNSGFASNPGFANNPGFATNPPAPGFPSPALNPQAKKPADPPKRVEAFDDFGDGPSFNPPPKAIPDPPKSKPSAKDPAPSFPEPSEMMAPKRKPEGKKEMQPASVGFDGPAAQPDPRPRATSLNAEDPVIKELLKTIRKLEARMEDLTDQLAELKTDTSQTKDGIKRVEDMVKDGKKQQDQTLAAVESVLKEVRSSRQSSLDSTEQAKALNTQIAESAAAMGGFKSQCEETLKQHQMVSMSIQTFFQQIAALQARGQPVRPQPIPSEMPNRPQPVPSEMPKPEPQKQAEPRPPEAIRQLPPQPVESRPLQEPMRAERQPIIPQRPEEGKQPNGKQSPFATGNVEMGFEAPRARQKPANRPDFPLEEPRNKPPSDFDFGLPEQKPRNMAAPRDFAFDESLQPPAKGKKVDFDFENSPKGGKPGFDFDFEGEKAEDASGFGYESSKKPSDFDFY